MKQYRHNLRIMHLLKRCFKKSSNERRIWGECAFDKKGSLEKKCREVVTHSLPLSQTCSGGDLPPQHVFSRGVTIHRRFDDSRYFCAIRYSIRIFRISGRFRSVFVDVLQLTCWFPVTKNEPVSVEKQWLTGQFLMRRWFYRNTVNERRLLSWRKGDW